MSDKKLKTLLADVVRLADKHGPRSEEVRKFLTANKNIPEFAELASALILLREDEIINNCEHLFTRKKVRNKSYISFGLAVLCIVILVAVYYLVVLV
ncbi:hypothetical protein LCGC14_1210050 [marine sediment metagenome]|uniref:Uncharacterized protein n=1 Tax=marine sediment metagenome TaxID=412755 RepID=A0A0F9LIM1_9ZZZZ